MLNGTTSKIASAKRDCNLLSGLYIGSSGQGGNLDNFFSRENQPCPPTLSDAGNLRQATAKADLLPCFEYIVLSFSEKPLGQAVMIDGPALVHMLKPLAFDRRSHKKLTFEDYSQDLFIPFLRSQLAGYERIDDV